MGARRRSRGRSSQREGAPSPCRVKELACPLVEAPPSLPPPAINVPMQYTSPLLSPAACDAPPGGDPSKAEGSGEDPPLARDSSRRSAPCRFAAWLHPIQSPASDRAAAAAAPCSLLSGGGLTPVPCTLPAASSHIGGGRSGMKRQDPGGDETGGSKRRQGLTRGGVRGAMSELAVRKWRKKETQGCLLA